MTRRAFVVSRWLASWPAAVIRAFHKVQPRPRAHVASSRPSASRKAVRLLPENRVHAMARSQAGSPIPDVPKSITAQSLPSRNKQIAPGDVAVKPDRWPCPSGRECLRPDPSRRLCVALTVQTYHRSTHLGVIDARACTAVEVVRAGQGTAVGSALRKATRKPARSMANCSTSAICSTVAGLPSSHR